MGVELKKMNEQDFQWFIETATKNFAQEKIRNGSWKKETAIKQSSETFSILLPQKQNTQNHFLRNIVNSQGERLGYLWYALEEVAIPCVFLYEIFLLPMSRGQGTGKVAMTLLKQEVKKLGIHSIRLHVFGHNEKAFGFYKKLGFIVTDYTMSFQTD